MGVISGNFGSSPVTTFALAKARKSYNINDKNTTEIWGKQQGTLERRPVTAEAAGSSPVSRAIISMAY